MSTEKKVIRLSGQVSQTVESSEVLTQKYGRLRPAQGLKLDPALLRRVAPVSLVLETAEGHIVLLRTPASKGDAAVEQLRARLRDFADLSEEFCATNVIQQMSGEPSSGGSSVHTPLVSSTLHDSLFREIVASAIEEGASDIHVRVRNAGGEDSAKIFFRVDSELEQTKYSMTPRQAHEVVAAGFAKSDARSLATGEGQFNLQIPLSSFIRIPDLKNVELRFQSAPERYGFDVTIRVLNYDKKLKSSTISDLGYTKDQERVLLEHGHGPGGAVLFVGETGSGKTTAMNALISSHPRVVDGTAYASTLEDPPEGRPANVSQFAVARSANMGGTGDANPFVSALRVRMRSDGDLIAVGEIRDSSSAEMFAQVAMTGHKAFASLHAASAKGAFERLVSPLMGLASETVGSEDVLGLVVFQKLVPKLCPHCRIPVKSGWAKSDYGLEKLTRLEKDFGLDVSGVYLRNHAGCPHCKGGRKGVQVVAEMFSPSEKQRVLIADGHISKAFVDWRRSRKAGMTNPDMHGKTAFEVGLYFVSKGQVGADTLDETVGRILQQEILPGGGAA